jgi:hypothetical protein
VPPDTSSPRAEGERLTGFVAPEATAREIEMIPR